MQSFYIWYQTSMNIHQRNLSTNQANSSFKDNRRSLSKWSLFPFCFWLQWLQLPWKNVRLDIFSLRSTTVSIDYFQTYNVMMNQWILNVFNNFAEQGDSKFNIFINSSNSQGMLWGCKHSRVLSWPLLTCWCYRKTRK